eukprot:TRINITY_DN12160_c0_g1_i1.p2 TRINITY_DN12160_c0_g1~~TRINITY_DN12160_c0_g1_i1.p2  ORF type:complete len:100 (+),score=1.00 TRINITY_DN12160_c0_g1_i1:161-460(+)
MRTMIVEFTLRGILKFLKKCCTTLHKSCPKIFQVNLKNLAKKRSGPEALSLPIEKKEFLISLGETCLHIIIQAYSETASASARRDISMSKTIASLLKRS